MKKNSKIKLLNLSLGVIVTVSSLFLIAFDINEVNREKISKTHIEIKGENNSLKISKVSAPISIDGNDPSSNWTIAKKAGICTGNGTSSDPYVIEDLIIEGTSSVSCILIEDSSVYFRIKNCTLFNAGSYSSYAGIKLVRVGNATLVNNDVSNNNYYGIYLDHSDYNTISGNTVNNNENHGIYLYWSVENQISGNTVNYNSYDGIYLVHSHLSQFTSNTVNNNYGNGISSPWSDSNFNILTGNTINNNGGSGIELRYSSYCTLSVNEANDNGGYGINIDGYDNLLSGNTANDNNYGISLEECYNSRVSQNTVKYNIFTGISVVGGSNNEVSENTIIDNGMHGIYVRGYDHTISGNTVNYNDIGIYLFDCSYIDIQGNTISYSDTYGLYLSDSDSVSIEINIFNYNPVAIYLYKSEADLSSNTFNENGVDLKEYNEPSFPYAIIIVVVLIVFGLLIGGMLIIRSRSSKPRSKPTIFYKNKPTFPISENLIREIRSNTESKPKLEVLQEIEDFKTIEGEGKLELSIEQLRSKYKYEIEKIREKVHNQNFFINLQGIDQILMQFERLQLKERPKSQDAYLGKILDYATSYCHLDNEVLINEIHIQKAFQVLQRKEVDLINEIQSIEEIGVLEIEEQPQEVEIFQEDEKLEETEVAQDELGQFLSIEQVRERYNKYKKEIEKIREKFHSQNIFVNLKGVNEVINSIEKLNLKRREEFLDEYVDKLLHYAIIHCKNANKKIVNESHIRMAFQQIYRTEVDLIRKIQSIEEISVIKPETQPDELEIESMEKERVSDSEELSFEEEITEEVEISVSDSDDQIEEIPMVEETQVEEDFIKVEVQEPPEEVLPPEPQITNCPFCGLVFDEAPTFCPQCGMVLKKK